MESPPATSWRLHLCRWSRVSVGVPQSFLWNTCPPVQAFKADQPVTRNFIKDDPLLHPWDSVFTPQEWTDLQQNGFRTGFSVESPQVPS